MNISKNVRQLSPSELVYDFEHWQKCHIFSSALTFKTKIDLLNNPSFREINISLINWCKQNPFLRTKISPNLAAGQADTKSLFTLDRDFVLINENKLNLMKNVHIYRLVEETENQYKNKNDFEKSRLEAWKILYENEFNKFAPLNYSQDNDEDLLWRLSLINLVEENDRQSFAYCMILTIHHGITDARNTFSLMLQLLELIQSEFSVKNVGDFKWINDIPPPLEEILAEIKFETVNEITTDDIDTTSCKIPTSFGLINKEKISDGVIKGKFKSLLDSKEDVDIEEYSRSSNNVTRLISFKIETSVVNQILAKCKSHDLKLTGCLSLIYIIATHEAYKKFASPHNSYFYHLMVSLRPHLNISNTQMGYLASHLDCTCSCDASILKLEPATFEETEFWRKAREESKKLHERLENFEHFHTAKQDSEFIEKMQTTSFTNGGGAHFALSNLGALRSPFVDDSASSSLFELDEFFYQVSMEPYRWSTLIFNGISTLDGYLMWGITYNSQFIRTEIIEFIVHTIRILFEKLVEH